MLKKLLATSILFTAPIFAGVCGCNDDEWCQGYYGSLGVSCTVNNPGGAHNGCCFFVFKTRQPIVEELKFPEPLGSMLEIKNAEPVKCAGPARKDLAAKPRPSRL